MVASTRRCSTSFALPPLPPPAPAPPPQPSNAGATKGVGSGSAVTTSISSAAKQQHQLHQHRPTPATPLVVMVASRTPSSSFSSPSTSSSASSSTYSSSALKTTPLKRQTTSGSATSSRRRTSAMAQRRCSLPAMLPDRNESCLKRPPRPNNGPSESRKATLVASPVVALNKPLQELSGNGSGSWSSSTETKRKKKRRQTLGPSELATVVATSAAENTTATTSPPPQQQQQQLMKRRKKRHSLMMIPPPAPPQPTSAAAAAAEEVPDWNRLPTLEDIDAIRGLVHRYTSVLGKIQPEAAAADADATEHPSVRQLREITGYELSRPRPVRRPAAAGGGVASPRPPRHAAMACSPVQTRAGKLQVLSLINFEEIDACKRRDQSFTERETGLRFERMMIPGVGGGLGYFDVAGANGGGDSSRRGGRVSHVEYERRYHEMLDRLTAERSANWKNYFDALREKDGGGGRDPSRTVAASSTEVVPSPRSDDGEVAAAVAVTCSASSEEDGRVTKGMEKAFPASNNHSKEKPRTKPARGEVAAAATTGSDDMEAAPSDGSGKGNKVSSINSVAAKQQAVARKEARDDGSAPKLLPIPEVPALTDEEASANGDAAVGDRKYEAVSQPASELRGGASSAIDNASFATSPSSPGTGDAAVAKGTGNSTNETKNNDNPVLLPLPSRDESSSDPEIARAERRLWMAIDHALEEYSKEVLAIQEARRASSASSPT